MGGNFRIFPQIVQIFWHFQQNVDSIRYIKNNDYFYENLCPGPAARRAGWAPQGPTPEACKGAPGAPKYIVFYLSLIHI